MLSNIKKVLYNLNVVMLESFRDKLFYTHLWGVMINMRQILTRALIFFSAFVAGLFALWLVTRYPIDPSLVLPDESALVEKCGDFSPVVRRNRLSVSGIDSDAEAYDFWQSFQKAVAADNRDTVATLVSYPFQVNFPTDKLGSNYRRILNKRSLLRAYEKIFDDDVKRFIASTSPSDLWARSEGILTPRGEIWIGVHCIGTGRSDCSSGYEVKIRTIHGNSAFIDRTDSKISDD